MYLKNRYGLVPAVETIMMKNPVKLVLAAFPATLWGFGAEAFAKGGIHDWQMGFQQPVTPVAVQLNDFHNFLLWICTAIAVFVFILLAIIVVRFNARANPKPAQFTHNTMLEVVWTTIPVIILIVIAVPSLKLLYFMDRTAKPEMTLKVTGHQWQWEYEYPDNGGISFTSYLIKDADIDPAKGQKRLLSTDAPVVLPVDTNIQILVTAADVLHAFAVPAFGVKLDAVPGRINETWARIEEPGVYYGQCSELCGKDHAYMPIEIHAVSKEEFAQWVEKQQSPPDEGAETPQEPDSIKGVE